MLKILIFIPWNFLPIDFKTEMSLRDQTARLNLFEKCLKYFPLYIRNRIFSLKDNGAKMTFGILKFISPELKRLQKKEK